MTPDQHDNPENSVARETTEFYPFASAHPDSTHSTDETAFELPVMEQLPDGYRLPDPGGAEMPVPSRSAPHTSSTAAREYASGSIDLPPKPVPDPSEADPPVTGPSEPSPHAADPSGPGEPMPAPALNPPALDLPALAQTGGPEGPDGPDSYPWPRAERSANADPTWQAAPYAAPRAPEAAPPLRGPSVPWWQVRSGADRAESGESPAGPPSTPLTAPLPHSAATEADAGPGSFERGTDDPGAAPETAETLTSDLLLPGRRATPDPGWRRTVYRATGGRVRVAESSATMRRRDRVRRIRTPAAGGLHRVAVLSLKGGVGKTTVAVGLGSTLASLRGDRVIAVDGNPDRGTLSDKVQLQTPSTIRDLLNERNLVSRYADVRAFTSQTPSRLEILASDRDPGVSVAFSADDYRAVVSVLERYYSICITDCGTGLLHSAMAGILELADQIVLVSSPSVDGARSASATLDWLAAHGYSDLVGGGVVVLSAVRRSSRSTVDVDRLQQHFAGRCRAVVRIPFDVHLEEGAEVELELLSTETADAYLELAALVADGFARPRPSVGATSPRLPLA